MEIKYAVLDPSKNITVLVETPVAKSVRCFVASEIMKLESSAEQLGFIEAGGDCCMLDMAGGEFCGNAVRCASLLSGKSTVVCSGQFVKCDNETAYLPKNLKGIKHFVIEMPAGNHLADKEKSERLVKELALDNQACGIMYFDEKNGILTPLVYVPAADTLFWENSCASGSAAVCNFLLDKYQTFVKLDLKQPGGVLSVESSPGLDYIKLYGKIEIIKRGTIDLCIPEQNC